jgi:hypothetical protein
VWRIPVSEIDRPGSFASHMSRCVLLLMEVLREVRDHRMLLELCLQLRRTPEADKLVYCNSNILAIFFLFYITFDADVCVLTYAKRMFVIFN